MVNFLHLDPDPDTVFQILDLDASFTLPKKLQIFDNVTKFQVFLELLSFLDLYYQRTDTKFIPGKVPQKRLKNLTTNRYRYAFLNIFLLFFSCWIPIRNPHL